MGMDVIDYWFGDGTGPVTHWQSPARDGSVLLDFDGDGRRDDAMIDVDADGRADLSALDLDDDGTVDQLFRDDGTGVWAIAVQPGTGDAPPAGWPTDTPGQCRVEPSGAASRPGQTGKPDGSEPAEPEPVRAVEPLGGEPGQPPRQALADTDHDGWPDVLLFDSDSDGTADGAVQLNPPAH